MARNKVKRSRDVPTKRANPKAYTAPAKQPAKISLRVLRKASSHHEQQCGG
jgi:hypothetical protein